MKWLKFMVVSFFMVFSMTAVGCESKPNESELIDEQSNVISEDSAIEYSGKEGKITVYISGPAPMLAALEKGFEESRGDVVDFLHLGCGPLRQKVWTEKESGQIQADVVWGSDPLMYIKLADSNALEEYKTQNFEELKSNYQSENNYYTAASERYGVIFYNSDLVTDENSPKCFDDLKNSQWDKNLIIADATQSSTALALVSTLYEFSGNNFDYLKSLKSNHLFLTKKNGEVPTKVASGEFAAGIAPHDGAFRILKKAKAEGYDLPIKIVWPKEGALAIQRPIAIIKNESRPQVNEDLTHEFVDYILSKKAQTITTKFGFVSVRKDVDFPNGVLEDANILSIDWRKASENEDKLRKDFKEIMQVK